MIHPRWQDQINNIIWLDDPLKYVYLRETLHDTGSSRFPIKTKFKGHMAKVIGYELLSHRAGEPFHYRFWWLKDYDRDIDPEGTYKNNCPIEAVIPVSIATGRESIRYGLLLFGGEP